MIDKRNYVISSLELHLFFLRIMKEHVLFLEAGFTPANKNLVNEVEQFKNDFEKLLFEVVRNSNGIISQDILTSNELVTDYTLEAENQTEKYTGIKINQNITKEEINLNSNNNPIINEQLVIKVQELNKKAVPIVNKFINFLRRLINNVDECNVFTQNYSSLLNHILHETEAYLDLIISIINGENINEFNKKNTEEFWNHIMMEHALVIKGLLDPKEEELINAADNFVNMYQELLNKLKENNININNISNETLIKTNDFKAFKTAAIEGIIGCDIKSIILPLLADHVLREANHYIRLLKD